MTENRLKYLRNNQIRGEIAYAVGADPTRYWDDEGRGLTKAHVLRVAQRLQPADSALDIDDMDLGDLYEHVCRWAGGEYSPNAGKPWGINRDNLKLIHDAVDATDPREVVEVAGD